MRFVYIICFLLIFYLLLNLYRLPQPNIKSLKFVDDVKDIETGDLLLTSTIRYPSIHGFVSWIGGAVTRLYSDREWTHASILLKMNNELYVLDVCPYENGLPPCIFNLNPRKHARIITLKDYINTTTGYVAIRKLRPKYDTRERIFHSALEHCKHLKFYFDNLGILLEWLTNRKKDIYTKKYTFSCVETIASIYKDAQIESHDLHCNMNLHAMYKKNSQLFEDDIIYIYPGPLCDPKVKKYFDNFLNNK